MIKVYFFAVLLLLISCHSEYNEKMTIFINQKKLAEDSLIYYQQEMDRYAKACKNIQENPGDSLTLKAYSDDFTNAMISKQILDLKLSSINISMDSLSKMK